MHGFQICTIQKATSRLRWPRAKSTMVYTEALSAATAEMWQQNYGLGLDTRTTGPGDTDSSASRNAPRCPEKGKVCLWTALSTAHTAERRRSARGSAPAPARPPPQGDPAERRWRSGEAAPPAPGPRYLSSCRMAPRAPPWPPMCFSARFSTCTYSAILGRAGASAPPPLVTAIARKRNLQRDPAWDLGYLLWGGRHLAPILQSQSGFTEQLPTAYTWRSPRYKELQDRDKSLFIRETSTDNPLFHTGHRICGEKSYQGLAVRRPGLPRSRIRGQGRWLRVMVRGELSSLSWLFPTLAGQGMCFYCLTHMSALPLRLVPVPSPGSTPAGGNTFDSPAVDVGRTSQLLLQAEQARCRNNFPDSTRLLLHRPGKIRFIVLYQSR